MDFIRKYLLAIVAFVAGWAIGLFIFGWWLFPVQWTDAPPSGLASQYQDQYIETTAIAFAQTNDPQVVSNAFNGWGDAYTAICTAAAGLTDQAQMNVYNQMAIIMGGQDCSASGVATPVPGTEGQTPAPAEEEGGGSSLIILLIIVLIVLAAGIILVLRMRRSVTDDEGPSTYYDMPEAGPISDEEVNAIPLARFPSNYTFGRDNFDDSHSIENANGDFLGECGVGIAESIGSDSPKNVTAFEVWLFDKNDIRTVTKVIMSDHAFYDDAIKAKLAPKGEPILAGENEVVVLETAALIINAEIKEMHYGEGGNLPPQSFFETFTIELSAWAKSSDAGPAPDVQGQVDELLEY